MTPSRVLGIAAFLFLSAFAIRALFWWATPDAVWAYSAYYKGDAPRWIAYVQAMTSGEMFEAGLPLRPPGMAYVLGILWNGSPDTVHHVKWVWCVLGSLVPPLFFLATYRSLGWVAGALGGLLLTVSTGMLFLSTSLNNEILYVVLVLTGLLLIDRLLRRPGWPATILWGAVGALACLVRVEHVLTFLLWLGFLLVAGKEPRGLRTMRAGVAVLAFVIVLIPWHVRAWSTLDRYNREQQTVDPNQEASIRQIEEFTRYMTWTEGAYRARDGLPPTARHLWTALAVATASFRGETTVTENTFDLLEDAFGFAPEPLRARPFVSAYGPLNFYSANHDSADGGFNRATLEIAPVLEGGAERYPPFMSTDFPPQGDLVPWYLPHLQVLNHGYAMGLRWIRENPGRFLELVGEKLSRFWAGASLGVSGYGFPLGVEGTRHRVDMVVPRPGLMEYLWMAGGIVVVILGWLLHRRRVVVPWLLFLGAQIAITVFFFGYARTGATVIPVVALFGALLASRVLARVRGSRVLWVGALLVLLTVGAETIRFLNPPDLYLRGRPVGDTDPYPADLYIEHTLSVGR